MKMRVALVGPGIMAIPPTGWGAVETLIWDYSIFLKKKGHVVDIINTPNRSEIIRLVNGGDYAVVHIHYDVYYDIIPQLRAKRLCITSHYPYIDQPQMWGGYVNIFNGICNAIRSHRVSYFSISEKDMNTFIGMGNLVEFRHRFFLMKNGLYVDTFRLTDSPTMADRSIVLGRIDIRKRQHLTFSNPTIDYAGPGECNHPNSKGEWSRETVYSSLTEYGNMVLLTNGENATPLVIKEAMAAGLGIVVTESAAHELPRDLPWVTVVSERDANDPVKLADIVDANRTLSVAMRTHIREWVRSRFDWMNLANCYIRNLRSLRVVLIGPGFGPIPPTGWGAVETLIWDLTICLRKLGADVHIVNTSDQNEIVRQVNALNPDIVHLEYDDHFGAMSRIACRAKIATSHFAYLEDPTFRGYGYANNFNGFLNGNFTIAALSQGIKDRYVNAGCNPNRIYVAPNGANEDSFRYTETPTYPDRSIYLAKIEERKKQYKYQDVPNLYFAGHSICNKFMTGHPRHLGEWTKSTLYDSLSDYGNLVLLSDGEAHPLVVCEALICGLGVVVSRVASANLDTSKPWVTVIPDDKLDDIDYVTNAIQENRKVAVASRAEIREYALANVSWTVRTAHLYELYKIMTGLV